jgi:hypothetical protein
VVRWKSTDVSEEKVKQESSMKQVASSVDFQRTTRLYSSEDKSLQLAKGFMNVNRSEVRMLHREASQHSNLNGKVRESHQFENLCYNMFFLGSLWWRYYATSRKFAGSFPGEVIRFFNLPNHSSCTMALGSTRPLTEMSTRNLPGDKRRSARKAGNRTASCEPIV